MSDNIANVVYKANEFIGNIIWGPPLIILVLFAGIYFTVRSNFFQIRYSKLIAKYTLCSLFKKETKQSQSKAAVSQFQALSTALAATIGTGNIAGVATALTFGGAGAVFWMWISAVLGMMTSFAENTLGIYYRRKNKNGTWYGGAMYYIKDGLDEKFHCKILNRILAVLFCVFCIIASLGIGNMTQSNSLAEACKTGFGIPAVISGFFVMIICGFVIVGGTNRICKLTEKLVPFMAIGYILLVLFVLIANSKQIPYVFSSIIKSAFNFSAIGGGISGTIIKRAVSTGIKRGISSNEAGMGSAVTINASSDTNEPVIQGMWGIFQVFTDTIIMCSLTAFCLLSINCNTVSFDTAIQNITTENQFFSLSNTKPLISTSPNFFCIKTDDSGSCMLLSEAPESDEFIPVCVYGKNYFIETANTNSYTTFANIMSVSANAQKDASGNIIYDEIGNPRVSSINFTKVDGVSLICYALSQQLGNLAGKVLSIIIILFAFSTIVGWSFYGTRAFEYLFGSKTAIIYKIVFTLFILLGATADLTLVWDVSDTANAFMALPNLIAIIALSDRVVKILDNYLLRKKHKNIKPMTNFYEKINNISDKKH